MKLKIISDGKLQGTKVMTEDGQVIEGVTGITWSIDTETHLARAQINFINLSAQLAVEINMSAPLSHIQHITD